MAVSILQGDVIAKLRELPDECFDTVVTSPPYWGLRDYGIEGQLGLEPTLGEHLERMVEVFAEVHRVLKSSGTCWVNYGDCYATTPNGRSAAATKELGNDDRSFRDKPFSTVGPIYAQSSPSATTRGANSRNKENGAPPSGRVMAGGYLKPKDLVMVPNRFAIAMQEWGWWVRSEIIWAKPNPMPESVTDRPATSHEKIFMFTKEPRYDYDREAVKQACSPNTHARISQDLARQEGSHRANGGGKTNGPMRAVVEGSTRKLASESQNMIGQKASREASLSLMVDRRNLRNYEPAPVEVWNIATRAFKEAHFATFPPELVERCLAAGCPAGGSVLDPFGGAGTTALVADRMQRDATLIEINPEYIEIARKRLASDTTDMLQRMDADIPEKVQGVLL